jgi:hypothetical protein
MVSININTMKEIVIEVPLLYRVSYDPIVQAENKKNAYEKKRKTK